MSTEVEAAAALAAKPERLHEVIGEDVVVVHPPGWVVSRTETEKLEDRPRRSRGTTYVHDAASFVKAVHRRQIVSVTPVIYADESTNALIAVINDDAGNSAGWRDYRVELQLRRTPEWNHWRGQDGSLLPQEAFAEHVEAGLLELASPPAAVMLELAQTFHATSAARFKSGTRLRDGNVQFVYEEDVDATAGKAGEIAIPERLTLNVKPFVGSPLYEVGALFRYRLTRDQFRLGYKLDRPHEVERAAFSDIRASVAEGLADLLILAGPAPDRTE